MKNTICNNKDNINTLDCNRKKRMTTTQLQLVFRKIANINIWNNCTCLPPRSWILFVHVWSIWLSLTHNGCNIYLFLYVIEKYHNCNCNCNWIACVCKDTIPMTRSMRFLMDMTKRRKRQLIARDDDSTVVYVLFKV